jgi:hypothetical protein
MCYVIIVIEMFEEEGRGGEGRGGEGRSGLVHEEVGASGGRWTV